MGNLLLKNPRIERGLQLPISSSRPLISSKFVFGYIEPIQEWRRGLPRLREERLGKEKMNSTARNRSDRTPRSHQRKLAAFRKKQLPPSRGSRRRGCCSKIYGFNHGYISSIPAKVRTAPLVAAASIACFVLSGVIHLVSSTPATASC